MRSFSLALSYNETRSDVINGLIGRLLMQDIPPEGFNEINLFGFDMIYGDLDEDLLDKIVD